MEAIANDNDNMMAKEMIGSMINNKNGRLMIQQHQIVTMGNQSSKINMLKNNSGRLNGMLSGSMGTASGNSGMKAGMINLMKGNPQMMQMIHNNTGNSMMNGMNPKRPMNNYVR